MLNSILNPSPQKAKCFLRRNLPIAAIPLALACGGNGKGIISTLGPQQPQQPTSAQASQAKYEDSGNKQTDASGTATLTYPSGEAVRVRIKNASGQTLPNISVRGMNTLEEMVVFYFDTNPTTNTYIGSPGSAHPVSMKIFPKRAGKFSTLQQPSLEEITMDFVDNLPNYGFAIVDFIKNPPRWDKSKITRFPVSYLGAWTFTQAKSLNTVLRNSSALITIASGGTSAPVTVPVTVVTAKAALVMDVIDNLLDVINASTGTNFNRNRAYEVYTIPLTPIFFFIPTDKYLPGFNTEIRDYLTLSYGSILRYVDNAGKPFWASTLNLSGNSVKKVIQRNDGTVFVQGMEQERGYVYIAVQRNPDGSYTELTYTPPILLGDDALSPGKKYTTPYNAEITNGPSKGAKFQGQHTFEVIARETVKVPAGTFTDCWKVKETVTANNKTEVRYHWLLKDVGEIKTQLEDGNALSMYYARIGDGRIKYGPEYSVTKLNR